MFFLLPFNESLIWRNVTKKTAHCQAGHVKQFGFNNFALLFNSKTRQARLGKVRYINYADVAGAVAFFMYLYLGGNALL